MSNNRVNLRSYLSSNRDYFRELYKTLNQKINFELELGLRYLALDSKIWLNSLYLMPDTDSTKMLSKAVTDLVDAIPLIEESNKIECLVKSAVMMKLLLKDKLSEDHESELSSNVIEYVEMVIKNYALSDFESMALLRIITSLIRIAYAQEALILRAPDNDVAALVIKCIENMDETKYATLTSSARMVIYDGNEKIISLYADAHSIAKVVEHIKRDSDQSAVIDSYKLTIKDLIDLPMMLFSERLKLNSIACMILQGELM